MILWRRWCSEREKCSATSSCCAWSASIESFPSESSVSHHQQEPIFSSRGSARVLLPSTDSPGQIILNSALSTRDRKSTRLNSSHRTISYAVFCLKKKKKQIK